VPDCEDKMRVDQFNKNDVREEFERLVKRRGEFEAMVHVADKWSMTKLDKLVGGRKSCGR
jgi:hypothetical protein